ncbi:MAG: SDR family NAD(P)-dependent oxidoreductase [Bacteroidales bacterium]|nr:SDR family NAD(P)-dependent oxidoreductase [Bacteroidales bacterium]MBQ7820236.1 SDR family NAD(P)-dependent oxidoreductase [Bacteroidales bacterium]
MKKIVIVGATSGIGMESAKLFLQNGYIVGLAGRREENLLTLQKDYPQTAFIKKIDITAPEAPQLLSELIDDMGGMDIYLHVSGIGFQNKELQPQIEIDTVKTNCLGMTQMVVRAYDYLSKNGGGQIAVVSSIAGTKGLGVAPSYSATKRFNNIYLQCLAQLSRMRGDKISFTDIRPGFVETALLRSANYPMKMQADYTAKKLYKAVVNKKRVAIIDWRYSILVAFWRLIPNFIWERLKIVKTK